MRARTGALVSPRGSITGLAVLLSVAACEPESNPPMTLSSQPTGQTAMSLAMPGLLEHRAIDPDQVDLLVTVNDEAVSMRNGPNGWSGTTSLPRGSAVALEILWVETIGREELTLASYTETIASLESNRTVPISDNDYEVGIHDRDEDSLSNLAERVDGSDPFDPLSPAGEPADVFLPAIDPRDAPVIDGSYDAIWDRAQYLDRNRQDLFIDNLMIDQGAVRADGDTEYRWGGMHDGEYLYLFVFGEGEGGQTPFGDSEQIFEDDALEIFWDADNSKARSYDGLDDHQILIPLLKFGTGDPIPNRSGDSDTRYRSGSNALDFPASAIDFAVCLCTRESNTWEMRLRIDEMKIEIGRTFGFDIQLDDDRDGDARDVKWGWAHPSRDTVDFDTTWFDPSVMGTARLNPAR